MLFFVSAKNTIVWHLQHGGWETDSNFITASTCTVTRSLWTGWMVSKEFIRVLAIYCNFSIIYGAVLYVGVAESVIFKVLFQHLQDLLYRTSYHIHSVFFFSLAVRSGLLTKMRFGGLKRQSATLSRLMMTHRHETIDDYMMHFRPRQHSINHPRAL